jgi:hypothetical protein
MCSKTRALSSLLVAASLQPGCATTATPLQAGADAGTLLVYSATYASTLEESEYPAHTDYTVATPNDTVIERVSNRTGSFDKRPAAVKLPPGEYHIRAQYSSGGFVTIPLMIETGKTTVVSLDGSPLPSSETPIRGADGVVIGWQVVTQE